MFTPSEKSKMMFASLVAMFNTQAMMAMGKIHNPMTGQIDRNLQAAQVMIDILEMFEERTRDNRTDEETRMVTGALSDLRINYVYEANREANPAPAAEAPAAEVLAGEAPATEAPATETPGMEAAAEEPASAGEASTPEDSSGVPDNLA